MRIFLSTDGYLDQKGGDKSFPFCTRRFRALLLELRDISFWKKAKPCVLTHYDAQTENKAVAEDEEAFEDSSRALIEIPHELVPLFRELIAKCPISSFLIHVMLT